jgi:hypothetical protein
MPHPGSRRTDFASEPALAQDELTYTSRAEFLVRYWKEKCQASPSTPLRSAIAGGMVKCIGLDELVRLITADGRPDERLREKLLAHLLEEASRSQDVIYQTVVEKLLAVAPSLPHSRLVTVAYFLTRLYGAMSRDAQQRIVRFFLDSSKPSIRKRGYKLLGTDWHHDWQPEIQRFWEKEHEADCAILIVDHFDPAFLVEHIDELTEDLPDAGSVARLYTRACTLAPRLLRKLWRLDGITYAYVSARLSRRITRSSARELLERFRLDDRLGILAWCYGRFGYWQLLVELAENVESIEETRREERLREVFSVPRPAGLSTLERHPGSEMTGA